MNLNQKVEKTVSFLRFLNVDIDKITQTKGNTATLDCDYAVDAVGIDLEKINLKGIEGYIGQEDLGYGIRSFNSFRKLTKMHGPNLIRLKFKI